MESSAAIKEGMGMEGARQRMRKLWLEAAENALASHATSFAMLRLSDVLKEDSLVAALQAKGYTVQAPD